MKDEHVNDAAQGVVEVVPQDVAQDLGFGARRRAPSCHATTAAAAVFVQFALRWGRNWAAQWHLARAVGKRFRGCRAKRLYVYLRSMTYPSLLMLQSGVVKGRIMPQTPSERRRPCKESWPNHARQNTALRLVVRRVLRYFTSGLVSSGLSKLGELQRPPGREVINL